MKAALSVRQSAWGRAFTCTLALLPALLVVVVLFGGGLALCLLQSFGWLPFLGETRFTLDAYAALLSSRSFWEALAFSVWVACASTLVSLTLGTLCALALRRTPSRGVLRALVPATLPVPHVVAAIVTLLVWSQSGLVSRLFRAAGFTASPADFPALVFDPLGLGIILEYAWKEAPFVCLVVLAALRQLDPRLEDAARSLGAARFARVWRVVLPAVRPSLLAAGVLVFAFAFTSFEVPYLLGATAPTTLSVLTQRAFNDADLTLRASAMALGVTVALGCALLLWPLLRAGGALQRPEEAR